MTAHRSTAQARPRMMARAEAIERARSIAGIAAANAGKAETMRRLPPENVAAILESGLMPLVRPRRFGGYESEWITLVDAVTEVGRHCGSTGWCMCFLLQHQWFLGLLPAEAQEYVYREDSDPRIVTSFAAMGKARLVPGGYELSGDWAWGSGGDHCSWALVGALVFSDPQGPPTFRVFLLKPGQFRMRDTWHSVGLKGSGSNNIEVDPVFVPEGFTIDMAAARAGRAPGREINDGVLYRTPTGMQFTFGILTPMFGIANGVYDAFVNATRDKVNLYSGDKTAELAGIQVRIGETRAELDAAYSVTENINRSIFDGREATPAQRIRNRNDFVLAGRMLMRAADRLFMVAGARGLDEGSALQRHWRDLHAIANHIVFTDAAYQTMGRTALGLDPLPTDALY